MSSTEEQLQSIENLLEHKVILALPGSGKTHTLVSLVERIFSFYPGTNLTIVTFTNASAEEMQNRILKRIPLFARNVRVSTFASIMLTQFKAISKGRRLILGGEWQGYIRRAAFKNGFLADDLPDLYEYVESASRTGEVKNPYGRFYDVYQDYLNMLAMYNRIDLNMVSREVTAAINDGRIPPLKDQFILIDEYQDVSFQDFEWIAAHADRGKWITVVGDDDQAIYGWRGAQGYESIVMLQEMYDAEGYLLSKCFRCAPAILAAAKKLIEHNTERVPKKMSSARTEKGKVESIVVPDKYESQWTRDKLASDSVQTSKQAKHKNAPPTKEELKKRSEDRALEKARFYVENIINESPYEWAILARTNAELDLIERALAERRLNAIRLGGKSIFQSEHASGIAKLMSGLANRKELAHLVDGLGWFGEKEDTIQKIYFSSGGGGFASVSSLNSGEWLPGTIELQGLSQDWINDTISPAAIKERAKRFFDVLEARINKARDGDMKLQLAVVKVLGDVFDSFNGSFNERVSNLADRVLQNSRKKIDHKAPDAVKLATLTGSKGLEWKNVWIINADQNKMPSAKTYEIADDDKLEAAIEEERRLLYVGMTRAEDWLRISYTEDAPSQFISEIFGYS